MNFRSLIISSLLIGLVLVSLVSFNIYFSQENEINSSLANDDSINRAFGNITKQLNDSRGTAEEKKEAVIFESSHPILTFVGFAFMSILDAGGVFIGTTVLMFNVIFEMIIETLDISPVVTGTLFAILLITLILSVWRVFRSGE